MHHEDHRTACPARTQYLCEQTLPADGARPRGAGDSALVGTAGFFGGAAGAHADAAAPPLLPQTTGRLRRTAARWHLHGTYRRTRNTRTAMPGWHASRLRAYPQGAWRAGPVPRRLRVRNRKARTAGISPRGRPGDGAGRRPRIRPDRPPGAAAPDGGAARHRHQHRGGAGGSAAQGHPEHAHHRRRQPVPARLGQPPATAAGNHHQQHQQYRRAHRQQQAAHQGAVAAVRRAGAERRNRRHRRRSGSGGAPDQGRGHRQAARRQPGQGRDHDVPQRRGGQGGLRVRPQVQPQHHAGRIH